MGKVITKTLAYALMCLFVLGDGRPCFGKTNRSSKKRWIGAVVALTAANVFDAYSSRGRYEANPLLRGPQGRFNTGKAVAIKSAASGGFVALQLILLKKTPECDLYKPFAISTAAAAGVTGLVAARNYTMPREIRRQPLTQE